MKLVRFTDIDRDNLRSFWERERGCLRLAQDRPACAGRRRRIDATVIRELNPQERKLAAPFAAPTRDEVREQRSIRGSLRIIVRVRFALVPDHALDGEALQRMQHLVVEDSRDLVDALAIRYKRDGSHLELPRARQ